ncbi:Stp1/IreP family PP2C-type Ser/Thr phosphatase [Amnibacterium setariae]|uniref:Stp1/IreP family PP2C-type Ser/Thr phosphatase n=1 Tax=Amnibacterium setariae TaxID=2306585 RepID=A0A3A1U4P4_9MICO|nr:Stp1/IreP family PP2C-type Ser/Thr phosphatase [Amnibacterium setariae]RIX31290.1 Stp1/IreP family PP2C-type Ser/Thr phosphatase [Amnibacterium setariae]
MSTITAGAAVSHVGRVRTNNQDSGYAGSALFVVADGMGGHAGGDIASSIAVRRIAETDQLDFASAQEAEFALQSAMIAANQEISATVEDRPELTGMGTTVSALIRVGDVIATAHIGDSRIYLLRDGELSQITNDHTFVQRLVETGRITPEEAAVHPRRSVLMRVLGDIDQSPEIDTAVLGTAPGDRWMLCSDGLSSYVSHERMLAAMATAPSAADAANALIEEALEHGAPDNVTAIVLDIDRPGTGPAAPQLVGSAASGLDPELAASSRQHNRLPALLLHPIRNSAPEASFQPESEDYLDALIREDRRRLWRRRLTWLAATALLLGAIAGAAFLGYRYTQTRYYVGFDGDRVAIYQGVQGTVGPIRLSHVVRETDLTRAQLSPLSVSSIDETISASSLDAAEDVVRNAQQDSSG